MAKIASSTIFRCIECGTEHKRFTAKCQNCDSYAIEEVADTVKAETTAKVGLKTAGSIKPASAAASIKDINQIPVKRTATGIGEFDRVVGGGLVEGAVVLFAGAPGSGKSTLCLKLADQYARMGKKVLYSSGEESSGQIAMRAKRMGVDNDLIRITNETSLEALQGHIDDEEPELLIVDSLQTIASSEVPGSVGSISQSKEAAHVLTRIAKERKITMILVSQVVKG